MNRKERVDLRITLFPFTKAFPEIQKLIARKKKLKKEMTKVSAKLKTKERHFHFLSDLVGIESKDDVLVSAVKKTLEEIGYKKVKIIDIKKERGSGRIEDIQVWHKNRITLIEVKGKSNQMQSSNDTQKVRGYLQLAKDKFPKDIVLAGIYVVNHDNKKHQSKRHKKPFDKDVEDFAKEGKYGLTTTNDLLWALESVKMGRLSFDDFDKKFHSFGIVKF